MQLNLNQEEIGPKFIDWDFSHAAIFFEAEGCIHLRKKDGRVQMQLNLTDLDILKRFHKAVGVGKIYGPYPNVSKANPGHWKDYYKWSLEKQKLCSDLLVKLIPYLGDDKRDKANKFLNETTN